jgi:hypothetical protein
LVSAEAYLLGWLVYLVALTGFLSLGWYTSRHWPYALRHTARALVAALLLLPWSVSPDTQQWAPAWLVTLFDGLIQPDAHAGRAGWPLLWVVLAVTLAAGLEQWYRRRKYGHPS